MKTIDRITTYVAGMGVLLTAFAFMVSSVVGIGALAGAAVALGDWMVVRLVAAKMLGAGEKARAVLSVVLIAKMTMLLGVCAALLFTFHLSALGFAVGISALVTGVLFGGLHEHLAAPASSDDTATAIAAPTAHEGE